MKTVLQTTRFLCAAVAAVVLSQAPAWAESDTSYLKDLDIRQRPLVEKLEVRPTDGQKLAVSATVDRANRTYKHGDKLALTVKTTEDAYLWVFDTGTSGKVIQVFPNRHAKSNFVKAGVLVAIPGADSKYDLIVSRPKGAELITVIASRDNKPLTRGLLDDALGGGPFRALRGTASTVVKDLSISLRKHSAWARDNQIIFIK